MTQSIIHVNGQVHEVDVEPDMPLLWVLRDTLGLTGTKFGCGMALCGACTVHVDGQAIRSCVTPISSVYGRSVTTIEGLSNRAVAINSTLETSALETSVLETSALETSTLETSALETSALKTSAVADNNAFSSNTASSAPHPVQQAWINEQVSQCGFCQSGQIMSAVALLNQRPNPSDDDIDNAMAGNICRCGTYQRIRKAIKTAAALVKIE